MFMQHIHNCTFPCNILTFHKVSCPSRISETVSTRATAMMTVVPLSKPPSFATIYPGKKFIHILSYSRVMFLKPLLWEWKLGLINHWYFHHLWTVILVKRNYFRFISCQKYCLCLTCKWPCAPPLLSPTPSQYRILVPLQHIPPQHTPSHLWISIWFRHIFVIKSYVSSTKSLVKPTIFWQQKKSKWAKEKLVLLTE